MLISCFKASGIGLCIRSFSLHCRSLHVCHFKTQSAFSKTHFPKISLDDFEILQCLTENRLQDARVMLEKMPKRGSQSPVVVWTSLLSKFSRDGFVDESRALFEIMPERNVVTYNAMLTALVQSGRLSDACCFFEEMPEKNVVSWTSMLRGLADAGRIDDARNLFAAMPERNVVSWNSMIVGLIRNGNLEEARQVFDSMAVRDLISWNAMIAGYAENNRIEEARALFDEMLDRNVVTWTSLIAGYCRTGNVEEGYCLFQKMPQRNIVSWTAMIGGFAWNGFYEEALLLFLEMRWNSLLKPNVETFISLAYACTGRGFPQLGKQLHSHLIINCWNYDDFDGRLVKSLIYMYSVLGNMDFAHYIFMKSSENWNVQSLNYIINGYIRIRQLEKAEYFFETAPVVDVISWTSMINGYFSVGLVEKACDLFKRMPNRDAIAWTAMISGHIENEYFMEATYLFAQMQIEGVLPLNSTFSSLLGAAGAMAYLDYGRQYHCLLIKTQTELDLILENSLVSMYAKCGKIDDAYSIFSDMTSRDLISWNSMIMGFAHHGLANKALKVFEAMLEAGIHPNSVTFLGVLSACGHAGLIDRAWELYGAMDKVYRIPPGLEHYICMVNVLGRAAKLEEAEKFVLGLPFEPGHAIWGALLGVCAFGGTNAEIAQHAAGRLLELDPLNAPGHVALCNIYAANGQHSEEEMLRKEMSLKGVKKVPGCSWIFVKDRAIVFMSGERSQEVDEMLVLLYGIKAEL